METRLAAVARTCVCTHLRQAARVFTRIYEEALAPSGLAGSSQFTLLVAICLTGGVSISDLADLMLMDRTTVTRSLRPLETAGWVAAAPGRDRRERIVTITPEGVAVLRRALPLWEQAQARVAERLGAERQQNLMQAVDSAVAALTAAEA